MCRRTFIVALLLAQAGCMQPHKQSALARAAAYLWSRQSQDGGWHSQTYGLLKSGQSLTPFVLDALLQIPPDVFAAPPAKLAAAIAFIERHTNAQGVIGMLDPTLPDYPNYATALSIIAFSQTHRTDLSPGIQRMAASLRSQQFSEQNGWQPKDPAYGAWGMGGTPRTPPATGHVDLSMSRHVIEALRAAGMPTTDPVFAHARIFIERCQNFDPAHPGDTDGGFFFSTTEFDTNKAGHDGNHFRSYGTTTADGILALLAIGTSLTDARIVAAQRWLTTHHHDMNVPGFTGEAYQRWPRGLAFYYASASTQAFAALHIAQTDAVANGLKRTQRPDGSWSNPENLVKEDDPFIATAFAIRALVVAR